MTANIFLNPPTMVQKYRLFKSKLPIYKLNSKTSRKNRLNNTAKMAESITETTNLRLNMWFQILRVNRTIMGKNVRRLINKRVHSNEKKNGFVIYFNVVYLRYTVCNIA